MHMKLNENDRNRGVEAAKMPKLESSLKIREINLHSLKSKENRRSDGYLFDLKDEQIASLTDERDRHYDIEKHENLKNNPGLKQRLKARVLRADNLF